MERKSIVIDREYGSGGREIARLLSERLGMEYYDGKQLASAAKRFGIEYHFLDEYDEKGVGSFVRDMSLATDMMNYTFISHVDSVNRNDIPFRVFEAQSQIMKRLVAEGPCIFLGRCAAEILKGTAPFLNVFVYASDMRDRIRRAAEADGVPESRAKAYIRRRDVQRKNYQRYFTQKKWGAPENYDMLLNTSALGYEKTAEAIIAALGPYC